MMVKSEQVRFKKREKKKKDLSQARVLICLYMPEGSLRVEILFGMGLWNQSGGHITNC